jgi:hypothetical protein
VCGNFDAYRMSKASYCFVYCLTSHLAAHTTLP